MDTSSASLREEITQNWPKYLFGLALLCGGIYFLAYNEGRAIRHAHSLNEASNKVISLNPNEPIKPELDGHLVHITGPLVIDEPLRDEDYKISVQAVKLKRNVEVYQWIEEKWTDNKKKDHYKYITDWKEEIIDSSKFQIRRGHQNPTYGKCVEEVPIKSYTHISPFVRIGDHLLLGNDIKEKFENYDEVLGEKRPKRRDITLYEGIFYYSEDIWDPEVGDIRIKFYGAGFANEIVSVIAMQKDGSLIPYLANDNLPIALLRHGNAIVKEMFSDFCFTNCNCYCFVYESELDLFLFQEFYNLYRALTY